MNNPLIQTRHEHRLTVGTLFSIVDSDDDNDRNSQHYIKLNKLHLPYKYNYSNIPYLFHSLL